MPSILLLPGDGQGPGAIASAEAVISAVADDIEIVRGDIGFSGYEKHGSVLPHETLDQISGCDVAICGPTSDFNDGDASRNPLDTLIGQLRPFAMSKNYRALSPDLGIPGIEFTVWGCSVNPNSDVSETRGIDGITVSKYIRSAFYNRMMEAAAISSKNRGYGSAVCIASPETFPESSELFFETFREVFDDNGLETACLGIAEWLADAYRNAGRYQCLIVADLCQESVEGAVAGITGRKNTVPTNYTGEFGSFYTVSDDVTCKDGSDIVSAIEAASQALRDVGRTSEGIAVSKALYDTVAAMERPECMGGDLAPWSFTEHVLSRLHESLIQEAD